MPRRYTISDGKLVLTVTEERECGFVVSSPLYPGLWTQAETVAEAFENARDALRALSTAARSPVPSKPARRRVRHTYRRW